MFTQNASHEAYLNRINAVLRYIDGHLAEALTLEDLAAQAGFSPFHFHRIFTGLVGETPNDYLNRLRLEKAANMLLKGPQSITQIAFNCGFSSSAVFARSFRQRFGCPANVYRRGAGQPAAGSTLAVAPPEPFAPALANVQVRYLPAAPVIYVPNLEGYSLEKICEAWARLYKWAGARGLLSPQTHAIGISFDDPQITRVNRCRYYACLTVPGPLPTHQRVGWMEIGAGLYAVSRVSCAAEQIHAIYSTLYGNWLPGSGYQPGDLPTYEIYLQTPEHHPQGLFELEVCIPVAPL